MQRPKAFAGFLIVGLIALIGFAAFSATGVQSAPPLDLPNEITARVAGGVLGIDLGPDVADQSLTPLPSDQPPGDDAATGSGDSAVTEEEKDSPGGR